MKRRIMSYKQFFFLIAFIYFYIITEVSLWDLIDPQGIAGKLWFVVATAIVFIAFFGIWGLIDFLINLIKTKQAKFSFLGPFILMILLGSLFYYGPIVAISSSLNNRYKYIERSEKMFSEGKFEDALIFAESEYEKSRVESKNRKAFFLFSYLLQKSNFQKTKNVKNLYQATVNYGYCLIASGENIKLAENLLDKALSISRLYFENNPEYKIIPLNGKLKISIAQGNINKAERYFIEISKLYNDIETKDAQILISSILFYADHYDRIGNSLKASAIRHEALEFYNKSTLSNKSTTYLVLQLFIAKDFWMNNDIENLGRILSDTKKLSRKKRKQSVYLYYLVLRSLYYENIEEFGLAEKDLLKVHLIIKRNQGHESISYANSLFNLASFYFRRGTYSKALNKINESIEILGNWKDDFLNDYYKMLFFRDLIEFASKDIQTDLSSIIEIEQYWKEAIDQSFLLYTEEEKEYYVSLLSDQLTLANSIHLNSNAPDAGSFIYNNILASKSIALLSTRKLRIYLEKIENKELLSTYNNLLREKDSITKLGISGSLNELKKIELESLIDNKIKDFLLDLNERDDYQGFSVSNCTWVDIKNELHKNEAAVEIVPIFEEYPTKRVTYYAIIITPEINAPIIKRLCDEKYLKSLLKTDRDLKSSIEDIYSKTNIVKLKDCIWNPISNIISDDSKVFLSLSGLMHSVSFPALTIDENCDIQILYSTREIVKSKVRSNSKVAVLFGGIKYDLPSEYNFINSDVERGVSSLSLKYLPYTLNEINAIDSLLKLKDYLCYRLIAYEATADTFNSIQRIKPAILHFATHGFYFESKTQKNNIPKSRNEFQGHSITYDNPMVRTGLLLSGANAYSKIKNIDGILTAYEISKLNFSNTELVVLSSCKSALGDIHGYEGVFGLQRAFKLAGVNSILMSLWEVSDKKTQKFMELFYKYYFIEDNGHKALKKAQQEFREKYDSSPFYWAAFTIIE